MQVPGRGVLPGILGSGVSPGSPNTDPIPDQKIFIFYNRFQTRLIYIHTRFQTSPLSKNYVIISKIRPQQQQKKIL